MTLFPLEEPVLKLLHTADWHLGHVSGQLDEADARKLARARLQVVDRILGLADQHRVDAVLCAGDLFDDAAPGDDWWRGLAERLARRGAQAAPVVLLPGNHDPLTPTSVWAPSHPFRRALPASVHVVDRDDFALPLGADAVVLGAPCRSRAGERDLALALPARAPDDRRIRIGLVHGSTFDMQGWDTNFPIARDAGLRRGLDYLAIGDTHSFRDVTPEARCPTVYPGAPEPTCWDEPGAGQVALVTFTAPGLRPQVRPLPVAAWRWREETIDRLERLRQLVAEDLARTVLRLVLDLPVTLAGSAELEELLAALAGTEAAHGRAGALRVVRRRVALELDGASFPADLSPALAAAVAALRRQADAAPDAGGPDPEVARRALLHLHRLVHEER